MGFGLVVGSIAAGLGALWLLNYLTRYRERPGAIWFIGNLASVSVFCLSYGASLVVFDPTLRLAFEVVSFSSFCFMGPFFLAFGLGYTGRADIVRNPLFGVVAAVPLLTVGLVATNPIHGLVWADFRLVPVFGLATVDYVIQPWGVFALLFCVGTAAVGSLLLIGAVLSYGPLYRAEAIAVVLSTVPPTVGVLLWLFELGPVPQLHLTAVFMLVHVSLDAFAFVGTHMFETSPATQRAAEQTGLDTLADPVLVLDTEDRVVKLNDSAEGLFDHTPQERLPVSLPALLGVDLAALRDAGEVNVRRSTGGTYAVSYTPLTDPSGDSVGGMIVLYDLTEERQRKQQLAVLNRVLRHNLRNEMTVVRGFAESLESSVTDPELGGRAQAIVRASDRLLSIGEKVREFDRIRDSDVRREPTDVGALLTRLRDEFAVRYPDADIAVDIDGESLEIQTQPEILELALSNLIENALDHSAETERAVDVRVEAASDEVRIELRDDNDRIPEMEVSVLQEGNETPLQHGKGIGLWIVNWCLTALRGEIAFHYDDGNCIALTIPTA